MANQDAKSSLLAAQIGASDSAPQSMKKRARPAYGKRHRAGTFQDDDSSESGDDSEQANGRQEAITDYGLDNAGRDNMGHERHEKHEGDKKHAQRSNRRDRESRDDDGDTQDAKAAPETQTKPAKWGLTINMKASGSAKDKKGIKPREKHSESDGDSARQRKRSRDIDDEAMDALLGKEAPKKTKIESSDPDREPRVEDYRAVPIDDFGAALLRNFGWDGQMRGKVKEVAKHANLTGLGAKDVKGAEDLGAWNKKTTKDSRPVRLDDYRREESKKRKEKEDRYGESSYKRERERERERERDRDRERDHRRDR